MPQRRLNALEEVKTSVPAGNLTTIDILVSSSYPGRYSDSAIVATYKQQKSRRLVKMQQRSTLQANTSIPTF